MDATKTVIVGYDASPESRLAVKWAAQVAKRRNSPLQVVHATGWEVKSFALHRAGVAVPSERRARALAEEGAALAREITDTAVEPIGLEREAVPALVELSQKAQLIVIGSRGRGRLRGALLGSVAFAVTTHAECPVAVVRESLRPLPSPEHPIVVGVDGSESGQNALREAGQLASETGAPLKIVVAWSPPQRNLWVSAFDFNLHEEGPSTPVEDSQNPYTVASYGEEAKAFEDASERSLGEVHSIAEQARAAVEEMYPQVKVEVLEIEGRAEDAIVQAASDASLIVVGARGRGSFASLLLGSVSREVIQQADCAVYVIR